MVSKKTRQFINMIKNLDPSELEEVEQDLSEAVQDSDDMELLDTYHIVRNIIQKINKGGAAQEVIRDGVYEAVKDSYQDRNVFQNKSAEFEQDEEFLIESKRKEIRDILDRMDEHIQGDSIEDATNAFTTMLDILSQFCMKRTQGVISIRAKLDDFFRLNEYGGKLSSDHHREVSMMFSPEEILAMQMRIPNFEDDDPMKRFFTLILDQAFDVVRFNELSGNLLLFMSQYFLDKLVGDGFRDSVALSDFQARHNRVKLALDKSIEALCDGERVVNNHLRDRPVLKELPRQLRGLINIKIGLAPPEDANEYVGKIKQHLEEYGRARSAVTFDFNLLPALQHDVRVKHSAILSLQKDIMEFMTKAQEEEMNQVKNELSRILDEIETNSQNLKPGSPEYEELMKKKANVQKRVEESRRRLDVMRCQQQMVHVQRTMLADAMKRYKKHEAMLQETSEKIIQNRKVRLKSNPNYNKPKKKVTGMVNQKKPTRGVS